MLIADGGGGYGGTNWNGMDVVQMWQAVESQDTTAHYQLLTGWQRSYELTLEHLGQVRNYRQSLAEAWPPEKSAASAAYLQRLDALITHLQSTYDAAVANHSAFASATLAISLSRNDVKKIYDEYTANQTKLAEFKNRPIPAAKSAVPPQKPPVADGRQEQLNNQARSIMFGLSGEIIQARTQITKPKLYDPSQAVSENKNGVSGANYTAPPIPAVVPYHPDAAGSSSSGSSSQHVRPAQTVNTGNDPAQPSPADGRQPGLVLGGTGLSPLALPPTTGMPASAPPISGGGQLPNVIGPTQPPILPNPASGTPMRPSAGIINEPLMRPGGFSPTGGLRAMPPGGVIGGNPAAVLGQPIAGTRAPQRVNPVGGVLNPESSRSSSTAAGRPVGANGQAMGNVTGRGSSRQDGRSEEVRWDPDNPWETAEGVSPVVLPASQQRVDPGPAIGLN
jgi:hypothetical protein